MQTVQWYYRRLRTMSAGEIAWRVRSSLDDRVDQFLVTRRKRPRRLSAVSDGDDPRTPGFHVCDQPVAEKARSWEASDVGPTRYDALIERAEKIAQHRLTFFDLKEQYLGDPIRWNRDHKRGQDTPMIFSPALDYRDVEVAGDCKFVWEPNRHHQLVVLGRAYRAGGDVRFARAVAEQLDSWLRQNPFGLGMNWRSGLELGIRLINWVWAVDLIRESGAISDDLYQRLLDCVSRHVWEINRKYSRGSSVGNHLVGEAAGVFVATSYFTNLKHASRWRQRSWQILNEQILNQTYPDGGLREQTTGYHFFVLQFFAITGVVARATGREFPESYWSRLEKMFEFLAALSGGGDRVPAFGDRDDGYVLDLGPNPHSIREWLAVGAALFGRSDSKALAGGQAESIEWLLGEPGRETFAAVPDLRNRALASRALQDSGYYLLQCGEPGSADRISVTFDCGPLGLEPLAGHGHADALSFTVRAFGTDLLVDPGTYDYFSYPKWREYFRSTRAHNTLVVDGRNQSEMLGLFLWGRKAKARCLRWEPSDVGARVTAEHAGYTCLKDPVIHRRTLELDGSERMLVIRDEILARGHHDVAAYFHFAECCTVKPIGENRYLVGVGQGTATIELDRRLQVEAFRGSEDPICGWASQGYHQKEPATTLVGCCACQGNITFVSRIHIGL